MSRPARIPSLAFAFTVADTHIKPLRIDLLQIAAARPATFVANDTPALICEPGFLVYKPGAFSEAATTNHRTWWRITAVRHIPHSLTTNLAILRWG